MRHRIAAVEPAAQREALALAADLDPGLDRFRSLHRIHHHELRQLDAVIAAEPPRPGAGGQHHLLTCDPALLGDDAGAGRGGPPGRRQDLHRLRRPRA